MGKTQPEFVAQNQPTAHAGSIETKQAESIAEPQESASVNNERQSYDSPTSVAKTREPGEIR